MIFLQAHRNYFLSLLSNSFQITLETLSSVFHADPAIIGPLDHFGPSAYFVLAQH